jgi:hypothetical protein
MIPVVDAAPSVIVSRRTPKIPHPKRIFFAAVCVAAAASVAVLAARRHPVRIRAGLIRNVLLGRPVIANTTVYGGVRFGNTDRTPMLVRSMFLPPELDRAAITIGPKVKHARVYGCEVTGTLAKVDTPQPESIAVRLGDDVTAGGRRG